MARLIVEVGGQTRRFKLGDGKLTLGSGEGASLTLDGFDTDANQVWGAATIGTLGDGSGGLVTVTPDEIPVWCDSME